jgi:nicotinamide phosphoribosyltransferase
LEGLASKGFASSNVVLGIGSYTYQYVTRDTLGQAVKATYGEVGGIGRNIFKKPKTDDGTKNSAKGLLRVEQQPKHMGGNIVLFEEQNWLEENHGVLQTIFKNGIPYNQTTLAEIRARVEKQL